MGLGLGLGLGLWIKGNKGLNVPKLMPFDIDFKDEIFYFNYFFIFC